MLHFFLALLMLAFSASPTPTPIWYFGQSNDTNEVIAFTTSGQIKDLHVAGDAQFGVRADAQNALFVLTDSNNTAHLYHVSPDKATEITVSGDVDQLRRVLAANSSYVVLTQNSLQPSAALLIDLASDRAVALTGQVVSVARISQDGKLLRYMSSDGSHWTLIERTLASGAERSIYNVASSDQYAQAAADSKGERWLFVDSQGSGLPQFDLIASEGTVTQLDRGTKDQPRFWRFFHDDLIGNTTGCGNRCALEVRSASADMTITLPADDVYQPLAEPQSGSLLVMDSQSVVWLLRSGDAAVKLGTYDPTRVFEPPSQLISPDGRYLPVQSSDDQFSVVDLTSAKPVAQISGQFLGQIFYSDQGFTIHTYGAATGSDQAIAYRYSDGKTLTLPNAATSLYVDLLPDGTLLDWVQANTAGVGERGIYTYDPAAQKYTVLVANARVLVAHSVS